MKFDGTIDELRLLVADAHCRGRWRQTKDKRWRFVESDTGAGMNWAPSTQNVWFDGPEPAKGYLADTVELALMSWADTSKHRPPTLDAFFF